jgi:hypothetical protein
MLQNWEAWKLITKSSKTHGPLRITGHALDWARRLRNPNKALTYDSRMTDLYDAIDPVCGAKFFHLSELVPPPPPRPLFYPCPCVLLLDEMACAHYLPFLDHILTLLAALQVYNHGYDPTQVQDFDNSQATFLLAKFRPAIGSANTLMIPPCLHPFTPPCYLIRLSHAMSGAFCMSWQGSTTRTGPVRGLKNRTGPVQKSRPHPGPPYKIRKIQTSSGAPV